MMMCCKPDSQVINSRVQIIETSPKPIKINKINFYFENSASMDGYLMGENFRNSMAEIIYNFKTDTINTYFVNTKDYKTSTILKKIREKNISVGDISNSDHKYIFTNAIKNTSVNNLCIVVTDGIYSMSNGKLTLGDIEKDIEIAFENALRKNEIETVVLKMSSHFKGTYYSETCEPGHKAIPIDQERPYYIILFGNKEVINKALNEIVVKEDLDGYKEQARFLITKGLKVDYSILLNGEDKKGSFTPSVRKNKIIKSINLEEKFQPHNSGSNEAYFQFAIAVNFNNLSIPEDYLLNPENYTISDKTDYEVLQIKELKNVDQSTLNDIKIRDDNFSHLMILKGKSKLYGDVNIQLDVKIPDWIKSTGSDDDCNILKDKDTTTTFSFDRLMLGISTAYEKVSKKKEYFNLEIKINT